MLQKHYLPENENTNEQQRQTKQIDKKNPARHLCTHLRQAKMPSRGQMWLLQDLSQGGGDHCRQRLQKFLADLIIARKTQR